MSRVHHSASQLDSNYSLLLQYYFTNTTTSPWWTTFLSSVRRIGPKKHDPVLSRKDLTLLIRSSQERFSPTLRILLFQWILIYREESSPQYVGWGGGGEFSAFEFSITQGLSTCVRKVETLASKTKSGISSLTEKLNGGLLLCRRANWCIYWYI